MNVAGPKERATFSLSPEVKGRLDAAVPKSERSGFVNQAIEKALKEAAIEDALRALDSLEPQPLLGAGVVETLREVRAERETQLATRHKATPR